MLTKDGKGGRRGEPEDDKGEGGLDSGNPPKLAADIICRQPLTNLRTCFLGTPF